MELRKLFRFAACGWWTEDIPLASFLWLTMLNRIYQRGRPISLSYGARPRHYISKGCGDD